MAPQNLVAERIRQLREARQLSVEQVAERGGLKSTQVAQIEEGGTPASLAPLLKIARGLGVRLGTLLDDVPQPGPALVRAGEAHRTVRLSGGKATGVEVHALAASKQDRHMEPFLVDAHPAPAPGALLSSHEGEEFLYVLEGRLEVAYGKETYVLGAGDSLYYDSIVPHDVHAAPGAEARVLAVVFTPC